MEIVNGKIEDYIASLHPTSDAVLADMEKYGEKKNFPIVGPLVGRILYQYTVMRHASSVFEMGSGFGYSTYWFALGLVHPGFIYHTDTSPEYSKMAQDYFRQGKLLNKVRFLVGNALDLIDKTREHFDIIFIDIQKEDYPSAYEKAKKKLKAGGLLIADNVLWSGKVATRAADPATEGIKRFNQLLAADKDFFNVVLPVRDGVSVNLKLR